MARTKQTARKNTRGKPLAMGRGKATPKKNPTPGGRADRKVVLEYSSDETPDENAPQPAEGAQAPKRVKKQIHLTLPTSPAHVTTMETFSTFFINHGLTRALQKAFAKRGWSTDQMREFVTNFQKKHGQQVPMPKIYGDEDSTDSEGPEVADGTKAVKKTTGGDEDTDASSDADDLSEVSMASAGGIGKQEFEGLLSDIAAQHQQMAASLDALASRVEDMSVEQVEEAAVRVVSESGHVRGLEEITGVFDKSEVALILACGVRRYQEYQALKGKREDKDIISYRQLQKKFGTNKRTLMEVIQGYKYRYPGGVSTKVPLVPTKSEEGEEAPATSRRPQQVTPPQHKSSRD